MSDETKIQIVKIKGRKASEELEVLDNEERKTLLRQEICALLKTILSNILPEDEKLSIEFHVAERTTIFKIDCRQDSYGHLVGRGGQTIESLRRITTTMTMKNGFRSVIEIPYFNNSSR
ncbi:MAG: hypothetical protein OM95_09555 [Bdellovibrio sp. ArHS]|uniref:KH domain-containing protein n=1 Tax=Bdellovibrio sp. ArHS TaxID=1569284 RepID=UPI0005836252|nr:KH domain-containing protein [Bdellovibrio sp. ArHS]KHD88371.1 MAG: hypothetical protein OM95_09555 [Bdellovibrio sp. ArHS]